VSERDVDTVRQLFDAFNRRDYDTSAAFAHPDVELYPPGGQPPYRGREALRQWMEPDAFSEQSGELRGIEAIGDALVTEAHAWMTGAASGIEMEVDWWGVWWLDADSRVTRCEVFLDRQAALAAADRRD
jgi:ketosteroid isomerase-like protein